MAGLTGVAIGLGMLNGCVTDEPTLFSYEAPEEVVDVEDDPVSGITVDLPSSFMQSCVTDALQFVGNPDLLCLDEIDSTEEGYDPSYDQEDCLAVTELFRDELTDASITTLDWHGYSEEEFENGDLPLTIGIENLPAWQVMIIVPGHHDVQSNAEGFEELKMNPHFGCYGLSVKEGNGFEFDVVPEGSEYYSESAVSLRMRAFDNPEEGMNFGFRQLLHHEGEDSDIYDQEFTPDYNIAGSWVLTEGAYQDHVEIIDLLTPVGNWVVFQTTS